MTPRECRMLDVVASLNAKDVEGVPGWIGNAAVGDWMLENVPRFECPDAAIELSYYFRWWSYRKHLKPTRDGVIVTEFGSEVPWAGKHGSIPAALGHHLYEGRWLRNAGRYLDDCIRFWLSKGSGLLSYSSWFADAILRYCETTDRMALAVEGLDALVRLYAERESSNLHSSGLYWSRDDRDAMEYSISGDGLRPTLNSYAYGDAVAISRIAAAAGRAGIEAEFMDKADRLGLLIRERLWDEEAGFFKTVPLAAREMEPETWDFAMMDASRNVREEIGFLPWYFGIPDTGEMGAAQRAWRELTSPEGFDAPFGPTTAERRHPRCNFPSEHECLWNGPSWPFATSQTLTAMAMALREYPRGTVTAAEYHRILSSYAASQRLTNLKGERVCWIDENLDPQSGEWLSRSILESHNWPEAKGGRERGKDYNHSTFCDLVISGLMGVCGREDGVSRPEPLLPPEWAYACLEGVLLNGREVSIYYDRDGSRYGRGAGPRVEIS